MLESLYEKIICLRTPELRFSKLVVIGVGRKSKGGGPKMSNSSGVLRCGIRNQVGVFKQNGRQKTNIFAFSTAHPGIYLSHTAYRTYLECTGLPVYLVSSDILSIGKHQKCGWNWWKYGKITLSFGSGFLCRMYENHQLVTVECRYPNLAKGEKVDSKRPLGGKFIPKVRWFVNSFERLGSSLFILHNRYDRPPALW